MGLSSVASPWWWAGFGALVLALLALDLGVFHRRDQAMTPRQALAWSGFWIALALLFGVGVFLRFGAERGEEFLAGYLVEYSLSVDNLFVFVAVFGALRIPAALQRRVLFWGILSALVLRAAMILAGAALLERFHWLMYAFGGLLLLTGLKLWWRRREEAGAEAGPALRWVRRLVPSTPELRGSAFLVRENGRWLATPLLLALMAIEVADVVFAVDSIPAVFGVTRDPFIVFTSNVFAILGLRSLYFALAALVDRFTHLKAGLALVLVFVGAKMVAAGWVKVPAAISLAVITGILAAAVAASLWRPRAARPAGPEGAGEPGGTGGSGRSRREAA
ncbi:MAG TPA: TerC family protein [Anaeromyxobacteraceae bacterium]|nr:TerC family protein [Anaeromyxobacteraceae bacterium]